MRKTRTEDSLEGTVWFILRPYSIFPSVFRSLRVGSGAGPLCFQTVDKLLHLCYNDLTDGVPERNEGTVP